MTKSILPRILCLLACNACANSSFRSAVPPSEGAAARAEAAVESFALTSVAAKMDLVWVIDNSASMEDLAAQVRRNFDDFIQRTSNLADLRLALISATSSDPSEPQTSVVLSEAAKARGHLQVPVTVSSTNLLALAAAASCPAESSAAIISAASFSEGQSRICGSDIIWDAEKPELMYNYLEDPAAIDSVKGSLQSFFRPGAQRAYVFVTDDDALGLRGDNFLSVISRYSQGTEIHVYSFHALSSTSSASCDISAPGVEYDKLVKLSKGAAFSICETDWRPHFDKLVANIGEIVISDFELKASGRILDVKVDGQPIDPSQYQLTDRRLSIHASVLQDKKQLTVTYDPGAALSAQP